MYDMVTLLEDVHPKHFESTVVMTYKDARAK